MKTRAETRRAKGENFFFALALAMSITVAPPAFAEKVALTFDDLPLNGDLPPRVDEAQIATRVLAILKREHAPQVFGFVNGKRFEGRPSGEHALKIWSAAGQRLGNHTYSHFDLHRVDANEFIADAERNESVLNAFAPRTDWHWLRYPYLREGDTLDKRHSVREYLHTHNYTIAQVTLDYEDYLWNTPYARCVAKRDHQAIQWLRASYLRTASQYIDADRQMAMLLFHRAIDHVLLLHLGAFSEEILPDLLALLKEKGFSLATLEEIERDPAYGVDPDAPSKYGGTLLEQLMDARKIPYPAVAKKPTKELEATCR